jgi:hypothetical protein
VRGIVRVMCGIARHVRGVPRVVHAIPTLCAIPALCARSPRCARDPRVVHAIPRVTRGALTRGYRQVPRWGTNAMNSQGTWPLGHLGTSCLRPFVPSSLRPFVPSSLGRLSFDRNLRRRIRTRHPLLRLLFDERREVRGAVGTRDRAACPEGTARGLRERRRHVAAEDGP